MPLFDRYIAVDWSAANTPRLGRDSIWIGELGPDGRVPSENAPTRHAAMASISCRLLDARDRGERVMLGFDFVFGYPRGATEAIASPTSLADTSPRVPWSRLWATLRELVVDAPDNTSNRFHVAQAINQRLADGPHFWGHPHQHRYDDLGPRRPASAYSRIPERRQAESFIRTTQPVWKLIGVGSVGSQSMLGIPRLETLRSDPRLAADIAVWPFETGFADDLSRPVTIVEIYPSLFPVTEADGLPRDRAQVEVTTSRFAALDRDGLLGRVLSAPPQVSATDRAFLLAEEGWIAGAGHEALLSEWRSAA